VTQCLLLSTTAALSPGSPGIWSFANEGADQQTVYSGFFSDTVAHNGTFDIVFDLATPFVYNPSAGNLLLDFDWTSIPTLNGSIFLSADYSSSVVGSNSNTTQYGNISQANTGVATQFLTTPEPGTFTLFAGLLLGLFCFSGASKQSRQLLVEMLQSRA
jgi:hypothetical protein